MADLSYDVQVNTSQAERNLTNLQKSVAGLNNTFTGLKTALAGISLGAIISQAIGLADSITDISDSTGIATANILGLSRAMIDNGGSAEGAQKAILKLVGAIGEAAEGSEDTQKAFQSVGVSLNDLRTLSEQEILGKTIEGLAKIGDASQRSVLSTKLLGKEIRNVGIAGVAGSYAQATAESAKYAAAIKSAADAQGNIDRTLTDFKIALLDALRPITELVTSLNVGIEGFRKFIQAVLAVGAVLAAVFVGGKIIAGFKIFYAALLAVANGAKNLFELFRNLGTGFGAIVRATEGAGGAFYRMWLVIKALLVSMAELAGPAFTALKTIATPVLASIAGYWGFIQESTTGAIQKIKEYLNYLPFVNFDVGGAGNGRGDGQSEMAQRKKAADEEARKQNELKQLREVRDKIGLANMAKIRESYGKNKLAAEQELQVIGEALRAQGFRLSSERALIGLSEDQIELRQTLRELDDQMEAKQSDITRQVEKLKVERGLLTKEQSTENKILTDQIGILQNQSKEVEKLYEGHREGIETQLRLLQGARLVEKGRLQDIENTTKAIEDQTARQQTLADILNSANRQRSEVTNQVPPGQLVGLSSLQKQIVEIQESARRAAEEAARSFAATMPEDMTGQQFIEFARGLDQIAAAYGRVSEAQIAAATLSYEVSTSWNTGWKDAFAAYRDDALNAAKTARDSFNSFTQSMEDAFVKFVQTGKLSFGDLANSIIADLARIAVKKAIVAIIGGPIGSLFGFANGGSVMQDTPIVVGERGPELFVPQSAGKIIANNKLGSQGQSMPEPVTVNYNIQAVDAASFRSLVARDPSFIYAVTEKGRQSQPVRRT